MNSYPNTHSNFSFTIDKDESFEERTKLFEKILDYLPTEMKEPSGPLLDAVKFV